MEDMEGMHGDHTMDPMEMEDYGDESGAMVSDYISFFLSPHAAVQLLLPVTFSNPRAKPNMLSNQLMCVCSRVTTRMSH